MSEQKEVRVVNIYQDLKYGTVGFTTEDLPAETHKLLAHYVHKEDYDSQSQLVKEKDKRIEELELHFKQAKTHAEVMEHKASKINGYLRDKEKDLVLLREHKAQDQKEIARLKNESKLLRYHLCKYLPNKDYQDILDVIIKALAKGDGDE